MHHDDRPIPAGTDAAERGTLRAVELIRVLVVAAVLGPAIIFGLIAWFSYQSALSGAERELVWTSDVAREHAAKVFDSYRLVSDRMQDLLGRVPDDEIRASERSYYDGARKIIGGLPQVSSLIVTNRDGGLVLATGSFPADTTVNFSDRDYFIALKAGSADPYVSTAQKSRITGEPFFGWGTARRAADGAFDGVIDIALSPNFFMRFYETLVREIGQGVDGRVVTLIRDDGHILVRYPALPTAAAPVPSDNPFFAATRLNRAGGVYVNTASGDPNGPRRLYAFKRVPGHPVYVVTGRSIEAVTQEWLLNMAGYLGAGFPAVSALLLISITTFRSARREQQALVLLRSEMARREAAEGHLRQAQKMEAIGRLAGGIAHDFNNLLTVIRSAVDFLSRPGLTEEKRSRYIEAISATTTRGAKLTGQLLSFARRQELSPEVFDAAANLRNVVDMVRSLTGISVEIVVSLPSEPLYVNADPTQFDTAIVNLAVNARDAMGGRGLLSISASKVAGVPERPGHAAIAGDHVAVTVADTGTGIAEDQIERIFEPFYTTKAVGEGTGLGLSQVFGFAKQSGGEVAVTSTPGKGSAFVIYLPLVEQAVAS